MKAMILSGGEGTRLRPLTYKLPKPLVYVNNLPSIEYIIKFLYHFGIREFAINVSYKADYLLDYSENVFKKKFKDASLFVLKEDSLSGTAGPVKKLQEFFGKEDFIVVGGDDIFDFDLELVVRKHKENKAVCTIALFRVDDPSHFGVAQIDDQDNILKFQEKPKKDPISFLANTGVYVFTKDIFDYILSSDFYDFGTQVFSNLINDKAKFLGVDVSNYPKFLNKAYWVDIGNIDNYFKANRELALMKHPFIESKIINTEKYLLVLDDDVTIKENTILDGTVIVGRGSILSGFIKDSIVWPKVILDNSYVVNSIIVGVG